MVEFLPHPVFSDYGVSKCGKIKSYRRNKIMSPSTNHRGYLSVSLYTTNGIVGKAVHRLVAETYIPKVEDTVNHINGDKLDNRVENLEWCSNADNVRHHFRVLKRNIGPNHWNTKLTEPQISDILALHYEGMSNRKIAPLFMVSRCTINNLVKSNTK